MEVTIQTYHETAKKFAQNYGENVSNHIIDIMASVMMTRDNFLQGGSFVQAVIENDLYLAISRGDVECQKNLKLIVAAKHYCFLND